MLNRPEKAVTAFSTTLSGRTSRRTTTTPGKVQVIWVMVVAVMVVAVRVVAVRWWQ